MKSQSFFLALIIILSAIPLNPAQAELQIGQSPENAMKMMYISDAILAGETDYDDTSLFHNLAAPVLDDPNPGLDDATMAAVLNALKGMRNDLDANCKLLVAQYKQQGKDCEAQLIQSTCDDYRNQINTEIGAYHDLRGDKRKGPTKAWHFLKRSGRGIWHKIGPVGRTFLRRLGPEVLQTVASGGSLSGGVVKRLVKNIARSMGKEHIKNVVFRGVERLLKGQIEILQAAGVDICAENQTEESASAENGNQRSECASDTSWVDPYWEESVVPSLIEYNLNCQPKAASIYYDCLIDYGYEGYCPEDAVQACDEIFQALPENDSGGSVSVSPTILHGGAESVSSSITYPSGGGAVSGQFSYMIKDNVTICTATITSTITSATYDQATCLMTGSAQLTMHFEGITCIGVCGPNTEACPKTLQGIVPFEAFLENGELSGGIGGEACDPGCFLFQAGP